MTLPRFRNTILLWIIGLYLLFNYGFMLVRIPPAGTKGIPIGEVVLLFTLLTIHYPSVLHRLSDRIFLLPFLVWWLLGFTRAFAGIPAHGMWALRDATHVIESLFILAGFVFSKETEMLDHFFEWLPKLLLFGCIYSLGSPFAANLQSFSPKITGGTGQSIAIFFFYTNTSILLLMAVVYLLLFKQKKGVNDKIIYLLSVIILGVTVFVFQARTIYLQVIAIYFLLLFFRKELIGKNIYAMFLLFLFLMILPVIGLQIHGRIGQKISLEFILNHLLAIGGVRAEGVEQSAYGVFQRLDWWLLLFKQWTSGAGNFLFGLGYGFPLVDFHGLTAPVREPHNSYISIIARIGLVGFVAWSWMHFLLLRAWHRTYKECTRLSWKEGENKLLIVLVFFVLIWVFAIGEDAFEKPFNAIPYYFFWGIVLRFSLHLKEEKIGPQKNGAVFR